MGKKYISLASIVLSWLCLASSCAKKPSPAPLATSSDMSATVSGTAWTSTTSKATKNVGTDSIAGFRSSDSSTILLLFPDGQNSGDTLKVGSVNTIQYLKGNVIFHAINGSIIISSNSNNTLKGTFSATVEDYNTSNKITITGGKFTAKF